MENSRDQFFDDSKKYSPINNLNCQNQLYNRQMIVNTKIIQSQSYVNGAACESNR